MLSRIALMLLLLWLIGVLGVYDVGDFVHVLLLVGLMLLLVAFLRARDTVRRPAWAALLIGDDRLPGPGSSASSSITRCCCW